jgi:hypothetical protein
MRGRALLTTAALVATAALLLAGPAAAVKGGKKSRTFERSLTPNLAIPDAAPGGFYGIARSELRVPKKFKGKVVADVNVTGIQTTGSGITAANDLWLVLVAPNGRTLIMTFGLGGQSIGPLTLDDDSANSLCTSPTPTPQCSLQDPDSLGRPFAGTANLAFRGNGTGTLSYFNGLKMRGTWTLMVVDDNDDDVTSVLNGWGLKIKAAKPVKE